MNEPVNPYASPQADITQVPLAQGTLADLPGLRTTGIGLSLVYYGIIIILLAAIGMFVRLFLFRGALLAGFITFTLIVGIAVLVGSLTMFAGQIACLAVPSQTGAKAYVLTAVVLQIASITQSFLPMVEQVVPNLKLPQPVTILLNSLGVISVVFFVLFMWRLSKFLRRRDLASKARNVLILGGVLAGIGVAMVVRSRIEPNEPLILLGVVLFLGGLSCFLMYANLINALRKVLLRKQPHPRSSASIRVPT